MIVLKRGSKGEEVKRLQRLLGIGDDGIFGYGTERAVKDFQRRYLLYPDGYNNEVLGTSNGSTATYEATGNEKYIRAMVVIDGKKAWTQPVWIIAKDWQFDF